jgi:hypothetical protein
MTISFFEWANIRRYMFDRTGLNPYSGVGIFYRNDNPSTILRSHDNSIYPDDLTNEHLVYYMCQGKSGDQNMNDPQNSRLLRSRLYLYRKPSHREWIWYGEYIIIEQNTRLYPGEDGVLRNIIVLTLLKIAD